MVLDALFIGLGVDGASAWATPEVSGNLAAAAQRYVRWDAGTAAAAAALEAHQHAAGFQLLLTAEQLQALGTLLALWHCESCDTVRGWMEHGGEHYNLHPRQPKPAAMAASRRLLQLLPDSAASHYRHWVYLQLMGASTEEELAAARAALRQAEATRSYSFVVVLSVQSAYKHVTGAYGGTWRLADVQPLVATATRALKHWRCTHP